MSPHGTWKLAGYKDDWELWTSPPASSPTWATYPTPCPSVREKESFPNSSKGWGQERSRWWQGEREMSWSTWPNSVSSLIMAKPLLTLSRSGSATSSPAWATSSTPLHGPHTSYPTGPPMQKSCATVASTKTTMNSRNKSAYSRHACPSTTKPSTPINTTWKPATSLTSYRTYEDSQTSLSTEWSNSDVAQGGAHRALGWESQSDERVMSPPKHADKLPPWSVLWYHQYHRELAHHMYISYIDSLMSHLPSLCTPHFGSEEPPVMCIPY